MNQPKRSAKTAFRPAAGLILRSPVHFLAFGFGSGLSPIAPGTMGTLAAVPVWWLLAPLHWLPYLAVVAVLGLLGCWLCGESSRRLGVHDHGGIVFDEIVGFLITTVPLLSAWGQSAARDWIGVAAAFGLFRLFDIWKPWPIAALDRRVHGGVGIMLDDVVAGLFAALALEVLLGVLA